MTVGQHCTRGCATARPGDTVREAAQAMDKEGVGCLVVVDEREHPQGIVTDRDLVLRVLRRGRPFDTRVEEIMDGEVVCLSEETPLLTAFRRFRVEGLRRLPVVEASGRVVGIFTTDDALQILGRDIAAAAAIANTQRGAVAEAGAPAAREES